MDIKAPISAVIITKNEEDRIARAVQSVGFCNEIIIVDSNSTDKTCKIATDLGAKVVQQPFLGYGAQKNAGFELANELWILSIDADEEVSKALATEITKTISSVNQPSAYSIPRKNYFLGQPLKYGREGKDRLVRLFQKGKASYDNALVHERMDVAGQIKKLNSPLYHYTYRDLDHAKEKMNKYATLGAKALQNKGKSRSLLAIIMLHPIYFLKHYLVYGNILNGKIGWTWSKLMASYHTLKYKKLRVLNKSS